MSTDVTLVDGREVTVNTRSNTEVSNTWHAGHIARLNLAADCQLSSEEGRRQLRSVDSRT